MRAAPTRAGQPTLCPNHACRPDAAAGCSGSGSPRDHASGSAGVSVAGGSPSSSGDEYEDGFEEEEAEEERLRLEGEQVHMCRG